MELFDCCLVPLTAGHPAHLLSVQHRMHPEIRAFPSMRFYGGLLVDGGEEGASCMYLYSVTPIVCCY